MGAEAARLVGRSTASPDHDVAKWRKGIAAPSPIGGLTSGAAGNLAVARLMVTCGIQPRLTVSNPSDAAEQEADRVAEAVVSRGAVPSIQLKCAGCGSSDSCPTCEDHDNGFHLKAAPQAAMGRDSEPRLTKRDVIAPSGGQPLTASQRTFFESRLGADLARVRIHTNRSADVAARALGAYAYTRGNNIVFRGDQYRPDTPEGSRLLAHELTHVVQQGAAIPIRRHPLGSNREQAVQTPPSRISASDHSVQRALGDGVIGPPGDCTWAKYLVLRGSVETAKAVVSVLGKCQHGDTCFDLALKIAAFTAEIAARYALLATCFKRKGGDEEHRTQLEEKTNAIMTCYKFFSNSQCPEPLIATMSFVVEYMREVIAGITAAVSIALAIALVEAVIALAEIIAALGAELGVAAATAAAVLAVLVAIRKEVSRSDSLSA